MNLPYSPLWTDATSRGRLTGTWRNAAPDYRTLPSPCRGACPVGGRIAEWIGQVEAGDMRGAWETLMDNNPFPAIAGRICHHPCETVCNRAELDETVSICALERVVGDTALAEGWTLPAAVSRDGSVGIVGGGPAGLSAAYQLLRSGFTVHLYEGAGQLGGLMRHGIPSYRLDRAVLEGEIARIVGMGLHLHLHHEIADAAALKALRGEHDAVYLATGASLPKRLPGLAYDQPWVMDSADFLAATAAGRRPDLGAHLLVIGGGSAAMDVARTARRMGHAVTVLALEPEDSLPAQRVELDEAREEGVDFVTGAMMQSVDAGAEGLLVTCLNVLFTPGARAGEFAVDPVGGSDFTLSVDAIIPAIGQDADLARWAGLLEADGPVLKADAAGRTGADRIHAGGDVASMARFVTQAVGMGKDAARAIAAELAADLTAPPPDPLPEVPYRVINTAYHPVAERHRPAHAEVTARLGNFLEVQEALSAQAARAEAARCFSCGTCTFCDNCYFYCPDMAITKLERGYEVILDYCKGCGLCVAECPTGAISMREELAP